MSPSRPILLIHVLIRRPACVALILCAGLLGACGGEATEPDNDTVGPQSAAASRRVAEKLDRLLELSEGVDGNANKKNTDFYFQQIASLMLDAQDDGVGFVREVIDYEVAAVRARNERATLLAVVALYYARVSEVDILEALLPYLSKPDDATQDVVRRHLRVLDDGSASRPPDFSYYQAYIDRRLRNKQDVNLALVEHMFRRAPGEALQAFLVAQYSDRASRKPLLWARHTVDDALWKRQYGFVQREEPAAAVTEQLEKMAGRDEWWARLYSAEIIRQHQQFGSPSVVERLQSDPHPLVQQTAKSIGSSTQDSQK